METFGKQCQTNRNSWEKLETTIVKQLTKWKNNPTMENIGKMLEHIETVGQT